MYTIALLTSLFILTDLCFRILGSNFPFAVRPDLLEKKKIIKKIIRFFRLLEGRAHTGKLH
jgi:hypothetical protein